MFRYKGYGVWFNGLQHKWMIQSGYDIIHTAKTAGACKRWINRFG